jgi:hypothetical protein
MIDLTGIYLVQVVERAGVELKRQGSRHVGVCPFHADKVPSFYVFDNQHFHCYGCGEHGDAIDFVQKYHKCDFKDALKMLGINNGPMTPERRAEIDKLKEERRLIKLFRCWEREAVDEVTTYIRTARRVLFRIRYEKDLMRYAELYHVIDQWEWHHEILCSGDDRLKFELFERGIYG